MVERVELLERAVAEPEVREEALRAAHQLAGSAGTFGFPHVSELARRCEQLLIEAAETDELARLAGEIRAELLERPEAEPSSDEAPPPPRQAEPARLPLALVVTQEAGTGERLRSDSERRGLRVVAARPDEVGMRIDQSPPDVAMLDLAADGALTALDLLRDVPVVVLGGEVSVEERIDLVGRGVDVVMAIDSTLDEAVGQAALLVQTRCSAHAAIVVDGADDLRPELESAGFAVVAPDWDDPGDTALVVLGGEQLDRCRVLRADPRWAGVTVVVAGDADPAAAFAAGVDDLVTPGPDLEPRLRNHVRRAGARQALTGVDTATGLPDRRMASVLLGKMLRLAERVDKPVCVARIVADDPADLRALGAVLRRNLRGEDVVGRWGDGLIAALFGTDQSAAIHRLTTLLRKVPADFRGGVAQFPTDGAALESLITIADEAAQHAPVSQIAAAGRAALTQQVDVAIIEDDEATSELITEALSSRGHRCWRFSNGAGAVAMLLGERPRVRARVMLVDLNLPAVGGVELLTVFGRDPSLRTSRIIVISAEDAPEMIQRTRDLGASDYFIKPLDIDDLVERVEGALGRRR